MFMRVHNSSKCFLMFGFLHETACFLLFLNVQFFALIFNSLLLCVFTCLCFVIVYFTQYLNHLVKSNMEILSVKKLSIY